MSFTKSKSVAKERERLQEEIAQINLALQSTEDEGSSNDGSDTEFDESRHAGVENRDAGRSDASELLGRRNTFQVINEDSLHGSAGDFATGDFVFSEDGELPVNLDTILAVNKAYQEVLTENLSRIGLVLAENRERQRRLETEMEREQVRKSNSEPKKKYMSTYTIPYFKDENGMFPPHNQDTKMILASQGETVKRQSKPWSDKDKETLTKAVCNDGLKRLSKSVMSKMELEYGKLEMAGNKEEEKDTQKRINNLRDELVHVTESATDRQLMGKLEDVDCIDWLKISNLDFEGERTVADCKNMWRNQLHPDINANDTWSKTEDQNLAMLVKKYEEKNWVKVAEELGTGRSAFSCLQRYQQKMNPVMDKGAWTSEEDEQLKQLVDECRVGSIIPWPTVCFYLEGRQADECSRRWQKLNPDVRKGKWTDIEDMLLIAAIKKHGKNSWNSVQEYIKGRTAVQCRERWQNALDTSLTFGGWSYEEDKKILDLVEKTKGTDGRTKKIPWAKIARQIPGRTDNMLLQRYTKLRKCRESVTGDKATEEEIATALALQTSEIHTDLEKKRVQVTKQLERIQKEMIQHENAGKGERAQLQKWTEGSVDQNSKSKEATRKKAWLEDLGYDQLKEHKRQIEMQMEDVKTGVVILRPREKERLPNMQNLVQKRLKMRRLLESNVYGNYPGRMDVRKMAKDALIEDKDNRNNPKKKIIQKIKKLNVDKLSPTLRMRVLGLNQNTTVRDLMTLTRDIKSFLEGKRTRKKGKRDLYQDFKVTDKLKKVLGTKKVVQQRRGRPKKFQVNNRIQGRYLSRMPETHNVTVLPLLLKTEGIDITGVIENGRRVRDYLAAVELCKNNQKDAQTNLSPTEVLQRAVEARNKEQLEKDLRAVDVFTGRKEPQNPENIDFVSDSSAKDLENDPGSSQEVSSEKVTAATVKKSVKLKLLYKPLTPQQDYNLPPFPPTIANLNGFKQLLLDRRQLVDRSQQLSDSISKSMSNNMQDNQSAKKGKGKGIGKSSNSGAKDGKSQEHLQEDIVEDDPLVSIRKTHDFKMLQARFQSLFLWPALLSTIHPTTDDEKGSEKQDVTSPPPRKRAKPAKLTQGNRSRQYRVKSRELKEENKVKRRELALKREAKRRRKRLGLWTVEDEAREQEEKRQKMLQKDDNSGKRKHQKQVYTFNEGFRRETRRKSSQDNETRRVLDCSLEGEDMEQSTDTPRIQPKRAQQERLKVEPANEFFKVVDISNITLKPVQSQTGPDRTQQPLNIMNGSSADQNKSANK